MRRGQEEGGGSTDVEGNELTIIDQRVSDYLQQHIEQALKSVSPAANSGTGDSRAANSETGDSASTWEGGRLQGAKTATARMAPDPGPTPDGRARARGSSAPGHHHSASTTPAGGGHGSEGEGRTTFAPGGANSAPNSPRKGEGGGRPGSVPNKPNKGDTPRSTSVPLGAKPGSGLLARVTRAEVEQSVEEIRKLIEARTSWRLAQKWGNFSRPQVWAAQPAGGAGPLPAPLVPGLGERIDPPELAQMLRDYEVLMDPRSTRVLPPDRYAKVKEHIGLLGRLKGAYEQRLAARDTGDRGPLPAALAASATPGGEVGSSWGGAGARTLVQPLVSPAPAAPYRYEPPRIPSEMSGNDVDGFREALRREREEYIQRRLASMVDSEPEDVVVKESHVPTLPTLSAPNGAALRGPGSGSPPKPPRVKAPRPPRPKGRVPDRRGVGG